MLMQKELSNKNRKAKKIYCFSDLLPVEENYKIGE